MSKKEFDEPFSVVTSLTYNCYRYNRQKGMCHHDLREVLELDVVIAEEFYNEYLKEFPNEKEEIGQSDSR